MSYQVLARKWRPKNFEQLVGQTHVSQALSYALDHERLHHAYLFTGTRGVGKTTIARILAKSLNCERHGISSKPCGACETCREIDEGRYPDLLEIDAASRTGVDETRELMDNVPYAPMKGRFKVYLIDEVHMFSKSSFNALLKTLEEPPPHVKFILATTDPQKLPITVLSRCLQFHLKHLGEGEIVRHLAKVLQAEGIDFEGEALWQIARAGAGSMRDSLSLLDQSIAFGQGKVQMAQVAQLLGTIPSNHLYALLQALAHNQAKALRQELMLLEKLAPDYGHLVFQLLEMLQQITIVQLQAEQEDEAIAEPIKALSALVPVELVQLWYQILSDTWQSLPYQPSAKLCVEMGLLRMMAFQPVYPLQDLARVDLVPEVQAVEELVFQERSMEEQSALVETMSEPTEVRISEPPPVFDEPAFESPMFVGEYESVEEYFDEPVVEPWLDEQTLVALSDNPEMWADFVLSQTNLRPDLQSLLENSIAQAYQAGTLMLAIRPESEMMWTMEREKALCDWLGVAQIVRQQVPDLYTPAQRQAAREHATRQQQTHDFMHDPHVQSALELLDARVEQIFDNEGDNYV